MKGNGVRAIMRKGRPRGWRPAIVVAGLLVLAAAVIPAQAAMAATRAGAARPSESCPGVVFIGARGSGQPYDSGGRFHGLGPEVNKMISVIQAQLRRHGITYNTDALAYPADSVNDLKPSAFEIMLIANPMTIAEGLLLYYEDNVKKYLHSISTGVSDAVFDMNDWHAVCTPTDFVLVGYSQGAMVMHQTENTLRAKHDRAFSNIIGTILLADGNRVVNTKAKEFGTSKADGQGIQTYLTKMSSHPDVPLPRTTANICNAGDLVCNFNASAVLHFSAAAHVHTSYSHCTKTSCTYQKVLTTAATWVGNAVVKHLIG